MKVGRPADRVPWPVPPVAGESLLSWVARTARHNVHRSPYVILRRCGLAYESRPYAVLDGGVDVDRLHQALGAEPEEICSRVFGRSEVSGFVSLDGVEVRRDDVITAVRRFAPKSVGVRKVHASQAMFRMLPFCCETWEYLEDACSTCGRIQGWRHAWALHLCDECCTPLAEVRGTKVARTLRPALAALTRVVGADHKLRRETVRLLPLRLASLTPGAVLNLAYSLATVCDPDLPIDRPSRTTLADHRRLATALAAAWRIMLHWESAFPDLVRQTVTGCRASTSRRASTARGISRQRLVDMLQSRDRATTLPEIRRLMEEFSAACAEADGSLQAGSLLVKPAARRLGVTEGEASDARDRGSLMTRIGLRNGRILLNFDEVEIKRLERARRTRLGAHAAGTRLDLPIYAVERLVACGLLDVDDHEWLVRRFGAAVITSDAVRSLQDRLAASARPRRTIADPVGIATVMRGYGGGPKPWESIVGLLIGKQLRFCLAGPRVGMKTICISTDDVARCLSLQPGAERASFSQSDALEILNLLPKHADALVKLRTGDLTSRNWEVDGKKLLGAAKRYVSYAELSTRTGLYPRTIRDSLLDLGCVPPVGLGWIRRSAMSKLRHLK